MTIHMNKVAAIAQVKTKAFMGKKLHHHAAVCHWFYFHHAPSLP